jgi:hypothetical protein
MEIINLSIRQQSSSEPGLLNKSSRLAAALGVKKFMTVIAMNLVTLCCASQTWMFNEHTSDFLQRKKLKTSFKKDVPSQSCPL